MGILDSKGIKLSTGQEQISSSANLGLELAQAVPSSNS